MTAYEIIKKKRDGHELTREEIEFMVTGAVRHTVPDYQLAAFFMAVYFRGMTPRETADLTLLMAHSGDVVDLSRVRGTVVDKHSTGGVGDTTTIVLAPLVAAAGVKVAKMSGRALGHSGGTLDKLESIPGFRIDLTPDEFFSQVNSIGVAVVGQTGVLVPADKVFYKVRDVTATVDSLPLIASSVMSKKIAGGAAGIVLDVKYGRGAFMPAADDAVNLARTMVDIGRLTGRRVVCLVTGMDQPLGYAVGNALEVREAINTLQGHGPQDLRELCLQLGSHMLVLAGLVPSPVEGYAVLTRVLDSGAALEKMRQWISAQGGDARVIDDPSLLPAAAVQKALVAGQDGYVQAIDALEVGLTGVEIGVGRLREDSPVDPAAGIVLHKKIGDPVRRGEPLLTVHARSEELAESALARLASAVSVGPQLPAVPPLVYRVVSEE